MLHPDEATVITRRQGRIGRITLNRPKALNALDMGMMASISTALSGWRDDPEVHAVVIESAGGRAFCAGGDIRLIRGMALAGDHSGIEAFFAAEYALNLAIARYPKPYVSLVDGVCMGGGMGLSIHGAARVASETAVFAMPETGIALFPDVGASYVLPRLRRGYGMYMGLTGARLAGADALWVGVATHFVTRARLSTLGDEIAEDGVAVLADAAIAPPLGRMPGVAEQVRCFEAASVPEIAAALQRDGSEWAQETLAALHAASPSSVLWSHELLRRGTGRTLERCLQAELALTRHATRHPDFLEGVRAMVVDKDRTPHWSPATLADVDLAGIAALFA